VLHGIYLASRGRGDYGQQVVQRLADRLTARYGRGYTKSSLSRMVGDGGNTVAIDPVGYLDMLSLQCDAAAVVTDSGGVQEETCMVGTPCVTVRRNTERQVTIEAGSNRLVAAERGAILEGIGEALTSPRDWVVPERWDDRVSARVVEALVGWER
jgi:UDP-N-acetylglucosamine 2-epimerase (non-hydrolysing)